MDQATSPKPATPQQRDRPRPLSSLELPSIYSRKFNDLAYQDRGLPPETEPTRVIAKGQPVTVTPVSGVSEVENYVLETVKPNVYQTQAGRRRAKLPDEEEELLVVDDTSLKGVNRFSIDRRQGIVAEEATEVPNNMTLRDFIPNINQQQVGRRVQVPDEEKKNVVVGATENSETSLKQSHKSSINQQQGTMVEENTTLRHVMLHWEKAQIGDLKKIVLNAWLPQGKPQPQNESQNSVSWQHSQLDPMTLKRFEGIVVGAKSQGLQESEIRLTHRLLKRVELDMERSFVGGKFLTPRALRYDSVDSSKYSADKCCIFLAFPYFAVMKEQPMKGFRKGSQQHPIRTLLQSVYRLNNTVESDRTQSIRMLRRKDLQSCIKATNIIKVANLSQKVKEELVFVPQLWAMILGLDRLMTLGPMSDTSLRGRDIEVKHATESGSKKRCSLVRIQFKNQRRVESLTYPIEQCASWFGLVNKQQQIRGVLKKEGDIPSPEKYELHIDGQVVEARTWAYMQKNTQAETLHIRMEIPEETPKPKGLKASVKFAEVTEIPEEGTKDKEIKGQGMGTEDEKPGPSGTASEVKTQRNEESDKDGLSPGPSIAASKDKKVQRPDGAKGGTTDASSVKWGGIEEVPIILPFFEWRVIDESGDTDELPAKVNRVDRFLNFIYRNLLAAAGDTTEGFADAPTTIPESTPAAAKKKIFVRGRTEADFSDELTQMLSTKSEDHKDITRGTSTLAAKLLNYFLPTDYKPQSGPMKLYWGALYEIVSRGSPPYLKDLSDKLYILYALAEHIHLGVLYYKDTEANPTGAISESAMLMSSMVDAFGAIFNILIEGVGEVRGVVKQQRIGKSVSTSCDDAQSLLKRARDELIVEASGVAAGEHIGPVLTPEAILIMHMERLVYGVYENGNVDVINIYEECLERLAMKVRYRYSRRLLQLINAFEEEVAVVHDVLHQQKKVLEEFRAYLEPSTFDTPSITRKMRFDYEQKGINRILETLRDQVKNCAELQERAKVLAVQNVHLVETQQDENGRAIFIFTIITVVFLPLSFVTSFFGMNLRGINSTTEKTSLFWKVAVPLTVAISALCFIVIKWGERVWLGMSSMFRKILS